MLDIDEDRNDVFVSYSRCDMGVVKPLVDWLSAGGIRCWMDVRGVENGDDFQNVLAAAIDRSAIVLFFSSANSVSSKWTMRELTYADKHGKPIVPVRLDAAVWAGKLDFMLAGVDFLEFQEGCRGDAAKSKLLESLARRLKGGVEGRTVVLPGGATMTFRRCPAGSFLMGSPTSEPGHASDEVQHMVTISGAFWIGDTAVTQSQWESVMGCNPSKGYGDDRPVNCVSWHDCMLFVERVNDSLGCGMRLPSEAEWEYACRAGTAGAYGGTGVMDEMGWCAENANASAALGKCAHPVRQKKPNAWGIYDMHGNVWEWCADWYGPYPTIAVSDPKGPDNGRNRIRRGGSWQDAASFCRSAYRFVFAPQSRHGLIGFRVVLDDRNVHPKV